MLKILLTGSQGQVGSSIRALASTAEYQDVKLLAYSRAECDITNQSAINKIFDQTQPDIVINAAAYTAVDKAEEDVAQAEKINFTAVENIALLCEKNKIPFLHISTDYVFDGNKPLDQQYAETDQTNPLGVYGKTKLAGEKKIREICEKYIILRTSWVFSEYGSNFVKTMLKLFKQKESLSIVADQYGGPTSALGIAHALLEISRQLWQGNVNNNADSSPWGIYHYSGQPIVSWCEFAKTINELDNNSEKIIQDIAAITAEQFGAKAPRPTNSILDLSKIKRVFNIEPCDWQKDLLAIIESVS